MDCIPTEHRGAYSQPAVFQNHRAAHSCSRAGLSVLLAVSVSAAIPAFGDDTAARTLHDGQRQLFLDDDIIEKVTGLERTLHQPEKRGAVILPDRAWETSLQTRCAPVWNTERNVWQIWLITSTSVPGLAGTSYAESADGIHWLKPSLGQLDIPDAPNNNFISVVAGDGWPQNAVENVVLDPHDPDPDRRYKGFYGAIGRRPMVSPDGITWQLLDAAVLPSSDESNLSYDSEGRTFIASLKTGGPFGRSHAIRTSTDFESWNDTGTIFHADEQDQRLAVESINDRFADPSLHQPTVNNPEDYHADIYNIGVFRYEGLYIGLPAVYYATGAYEGNTDGFHLIQLACSRDLREWNRLCGRKPFIGPSPNEPDVWDRTQLLPPSSPVIRGNEMWFYYTGIKYRVKPEDADAKAGAVCLAVLRRDGFVSLDAGVAPGELLTKPFRTSEMPAARLQLNAVVHEGGEIRAELTDIEGSPLPGFALAECRPLRSDAVEQTVSWTSGSDLYNDSGHPVRLRVRLKNASLYSFHLTDSATTSDSR